MFDIALRSLKDDVFTPVSRCVPPFVTPLQVTAAAFFAGLISCLCACTNHRVLSLIFWAANRVLDCLDGALARARGEQTDLGGFLDLLGDFIIYALVPIACAARNNLDEKSTSGGRAVVDVLAIALLEASFWLNNFVLFFVAALVEKRGADRLLQENSELTSLSMMPALIEGLESAVFFTLMLAMPSHVGIISVAMFLGVVYGTWQRVSWLVAALRRIEAKAGAVKEEKKQQRRL